jgi:transcriptional regulator with XRE-family HTH domain
LSGVDFATAMRQLLLDRGISYRALACRTYYSKSHLHSLATGAKRPTLAAAERIDGALDAGGQLVALARTERNAMIETDVHRRTLLTGLVALTVGGALHEALPPLSHVDDWEEVAWEHGIAYLTADRTRFLQDIIPDLLSLRTVLPRRPALADVGARMAALIAMACTDLGRTQTARSAWRVARRYAADAGRPDTLMWVRGQESILAAYAGRPPAVVLGIADQALSAGPATGQATALVLAARAQALAVVGRTDEALAALTPLRAAFDALPDSLTSNVDSVFGWPEIRLRHTISYVHALAGRSRHAHQAHDDALAIYPAARLRSRAQIQLHRAHTMVAYGDLATGVDHAVRTVEAVPPAQRGRLVFALADRVVDAVPARESARADVRSLRELVADSRV